VLAAAALLVAACAWAPARAASVRTATTHPPAPAILFGLGPEADGARSGRLAASSPVRMLSSWYNGPADLGWMTGWRYTEIRHDYAAGYALHLIVWSGGRKGELHTRFGAACGLAYPLSARFLTDMERLARTFTAPPRRRLYVTLFSEFQTYVCNGGNEWSSDAQTTAYFRALEQRYRAALAIFHRLARNSWVSLGWGGWQARWNDPRTGGGRSLFAHFADLMRRSDFESFEVIGSTTAAADIIAMTRELGRFGPVMLAYYKPPEGGGTAQLQALLSRAFLEGLARARLFAFSFMDESFLSSDPAAFALAREAVASSQAVSAVRRLVLLQRRQPYAAAAVW